MAVILDFQSELSYLLLIDLQATSILPMKFRVNCPFGSGEKVQNRFSTWLLGRPSWISDQNDLAIFDLQVTPLLPIKFRAYGLSIQVKKRKIDFQDGNCGGHLVFPINPF